MSDPLPNAPQAFLNPAQVADLERQVSEMRPAPTIISAPSLTPEQLVFYMRGVAEANNGACPEHVARHLLALAIRVKLPGETRTGCGCGGAR